MYLQKVNAEKLFLNQFFVGVLKVNDENGRIRIRIHLSEAWIRGSGSTPKCHGSAKLQKILVEYGTVWAMSFANKKSVLYFRIRDFATLYYGCGFRRPINYGSGSKSCLDAFVVIKKNILSITECRKPLN
jgi:hypothetical protein